MTSHIHINRPSGTRFIARVRGRGCRIYQVISEHRSPVRAIKAMAKVFAENNWYKRGDVIMTAPYYDPIQVAEIKR